MNNGLYSIVSEISETPDTPDSVVFQLANINYRLDILLTISLVFFTILCIVGLCYLFYKFIFKFIP